MNTTLIPTFCFVYYILIHLVVFLKFYIFCKWKWPQIILPNIKTGSFLFRFSDASGIDLGVRYWFFVLSLGPSSKSAFYSHLQAQSRYAKWILDKSGTVTIWIPNTWILDSSEYRTFQCPVFKWLNHLKSGPDFKW